MARSLRYPKIYAKRRSSSELEKKQLKQQQATSQLGPELQNHAAISPSTLQRAYSHAKDLSPHELMQLQSTIGNRALLQMMHTNQERGNPNSPIQSPVTAPNQSAIQRTPIQVQANSAPSNTVQRWWPFGKKKQETNEQKKARYDNKISNIDNAIAVLRVGHGIVMLPLTLIDLISNLARPFTGSQVSPKSSDSPGNKRRKVFHNVINGESQLVALMAGKNEHFDLKILKYAPWNIIPWIIKALNRWKSKINKKRLALNN